jgi:hypothetical protein
MNIEEKKENFEYTKAVFRSSNSKDRRYMRMNISDISERLRILMNLFDRG